MEPVFTVLTSIWSYIWVFISKMMSDSRWIWTCHLTMRTFVVVNCNRKFSVIEFKEILLPWWRTWSLKRREVANVFRQWVHWKVWAETLQEKLKRILQVQFKCQIFSCLISYFLNWHQKKSIKNELLTSDWRFRWSINLVLFTYKLPHLGQANVLSLVCVFKWSLNLYLAILSLFASFTL